MSSRNRARFHRGVAVVLVVGAVLLGSPAVARAEAPCGDGDEGILMVEGEVQAPVKVFAQPPVYTEAARKERVQGTVIVRTVIDESGEVVEIKLLKGQPLGLSAEAMSAIARWRFEPATLDGEPVAVYYNLTVNFRLNGDHKKATEGDSSSSR